MKVRDIMTVAVYTCQPDTDLGRVAGIMWDHDCGFVPVVDASGAVAGLITDRDICMAAATRGLPLAHISASQAMSQSVRACLPDDAVSEALEMMKHFKVRRLPVIDAHGYLQGVISMNDIARATDAKRGLAPKDVVSTLAEICEHRTLAAA
jgi:CBS domain-containing protein